MFHIPAFFVLVALYFLPTIVANARHACARGPITFVNIFLGWTFIGWIAAMVWALASPPMFYGYPPQPPHPPYPPYPPRW